MTSNKLPPMPIVSTGISEIDELLGKGAPGFPRSRLTEVRGFGATHLVEVAVASSKARGERVQHFLETTDYASLLGALRKNDLVVVRTVEQAPTLLFDVSQATYRDPVPYGALVSVSPRDLPDSNLIRFAASVRLELTREEGGVRALLVKTSMSPTQGNSVVIDVRDQISEG